ncbi:MAG: choice-of-anchor B family protein [Flavobacteriaceae bacterium]|nr:choice-of-anchor B family protein [Flavobacteriaceae bacterium]
MIPIQNMIKPYNVFPNILLIFFFSLVLFACSSSDENTVDDNRTPCKNGMAGTFPCDNYDLMSQVSLSNMSALSGNDSWGWTDSTTGKEYAIMGLDNGTAFIDISDPTAPIYLGKLPTATQNSSWRDIKVYKNFAFIVSEANNHGMQIFDLNQLKNVESPPKIFSANAHYTEFGDAHNIVINEATGMAYAVGTNTFGGGPHFIDIQNPLNPVAAGGFAASGYTHDAQVVTYMGPDTDYQGKEIFVGSNGDKIVIIDVSDKSNPVEISSISYSGLGYAHQGWFTEDQQYFIAGDELDEKQNGIKTKTLIFDFTDLDKPVLQSSYSGPTLAIDHNAYVKDKLLFLANYTAGVRFIDITNIANGSLKEIGYFDTYPLSNNAEFNGVWSVYPYFNSGNIVISDLNGGLFIVKKSGT